MNHRDYRTRRGTPWRLNSAYPLNKRGWNWKNTSGNTAAYGSLLPKSRVMTGQKPALIRNQSASSATANARPSDQRKIKPIVVMRSVFTVLIWVLGISCVAGESATWYIHRVDRHRGTNALGAFRASVPCDKLGRGYGQKRRLRQKSVRPGWSLAIMARYALRLVSTASSSPSFWIPHVAQRVHEST